MAKLKWSKIKIDKQMRDSIDIDYISIPWQYNRRNIRNLEVNKAATWYDKISPRNAELKKELRMKHIKAIQVLRSEKLLP